MKWGIFIQTVQWVLGIRKGFMSGNFFSPYRLPIIHGQLPLGFNSPPH